MGGKAAKDDGDKKDDKEKKPKCCSCEKGSCLRSKVFCMFCCADMFESQDQDDDDDEDSTNAGCCGGKKPWPENPNAPWSKGKCQDPYCIVLFILFWVAMVAVASTGFYFGSFARVVYAQDFDGQSCGTSDDSTDWFTRCPRGTDCPEDLTSKKVITWPRMGTDMVLSIAQGFDTSDIAGSIKKINLYGICVDECPMTGDYVCNYKGEDEYMKAYFSPRTTYTKAEKKAAVYQCYDEMWSSGMQPGLSSLPGMGTLSAALMSQKCIDLVANCWINPIDTKRMLFRCIPKFWEILDTGNKCILPSKANGTAMGMSPMNPACITVKKTDKSEVDLPKGAEIIFDIMSGFAGRVMRSVSDLIESVYVVVVCGFLVSFAASWGWVIFLQYFVSFVVWTTVVVFYFTWIIITLLLYMKGDILTMANIIWLANYLAGLISGNIKQASALEALVAEHTNGTSDPTPSILASSTTYKLYFQIGAYVMTGVFFVLVLAGIILHKKIKVAIAIIRESAKALQALPTLVFYPLWSMLCIFVVFAYFCVIMAFLMSAGRLTVGDLSDVSPNITGLPDEFGAATAQIAKYESVDVVKWLMVVHLMGSFWTVYLIEGIGLTVIATSVSAWYFTKEVDWKHGSADEIARWKHDIDDKPCWSHGKPCCATLPSEHPLQPCTIQRFFWRCVGRTKCCFCLPSCDQQRLDKAAKKAEAAEGADDDDKSSADGSGEASGDDADASANSGDAEIKTALAGEINQDEEPHPDDADDILEPLCAEAHGCAPVFCCRCKDEKCLLPKQFCFKIHKGEDYNHDDIIDCYERLDVRPVPGCLCYTITCCCFCQLCCYCCKSDNEKDKCYKRGSLRYCVDYMREEACPRNTRPDIEVCTCFKGCCRSNTFHLGPILIGAFLIAVIQTIRVVLLYIEKLVKQAAGKNQGPLVKKIFRILQGVMWIFAQCMKFITRNTYIMVAMRNLGFARASASAIGLLISNVFVMSLVKVLAVVVILIGKVIVVAFSAAIAVAWLSLDPTFKYDGARPINGTIFQTVLVMVAAVVVAQIFFYTFQMTIDTILLCFCEDCYQHDGVPQRNAALRDVIHKQSSKRPVHAAIIYKKGSKIAKIPILVKIEKASLKDLCKDIHGGSRLDAPGIPKVPDMELVIFDKRSKKFSVVPSGKLKNSKIHAIFKKTYPIFLRKKGNDFPENMIDASGGLNEELRALLATHGIKVSASRPAPSHKRAQEAGKTIMV
jgi:hypothetical protein